MTSYDHHLRLREPRWKEMAPPERELLKGYDYLVPGRYFHCYILRERQGDRTCWVPWGFCA